MRVGGEVKHAIRITLELLITGEKLAPITKIPLPKKAKIFLLVPLAATSLQPQHIKCFHIICIFTQQTQSHSSFFYLNKRGKTNTKSVFLSMSVQCHGSRI